MRSVITPIVLAMTLVLVACQPATSQSTGEKQEAARDRNMDVANSQVPTPQVSSFVTREMVAEYMNRMDEPNKIFYIYLLADTGNVIGYHVVRGHPVNICTFMTPPDKVEHRKSTHGNTTITRPAPAIDGLYYGGGGCNMEYMFDAETDALITLNGGLKTITADQPLNLNAEPIRVVSE